MVFDDFFHAKAATLREFFFTQRPQRNKHAKNAEKKPLRTLREKPLRTLREKPLRTLREKPLRTLREKPLRTLREKPLQTLREKKLKQILIGIIFALLWASASVATKFGIRSADPLILANVRFFVAGPLLLALSFIFQRQKPRWPTRQEWPQLLLFALLNTTIYLGAFVISMTEVSAGIGSLSTATGPLFVIVIASVWLGRKLKTNEMMGVALGLSGAALATFPLLQNSFATLRGLLILMAGIVSVSVASVYYSRVQWQLSNLAFNGWQVLIGGFLLLPFTLFFADFQRTKYDVNFWLSVGWLVVPVSAVGLQLWFYLLKQDAVKASLWLFLCPIFGFTYASILLQEPLSWHTFAGTLLVIAGLYVAQPDH